MAQKTRISALATKLLDNFQLLDPANQSEYGAGLKERILQALLDPKPARTNQFAIAARLRGLEEKFRVFNNDELADALHDRLDELYTKSNRWTPEILSVLLELSDQPLQETKIEDLHQFKPAPQPPPLTWSDIIHDDPLDNRDGLWDNVDFARDDSDADADSVLKASPQSDATSTTSNDSDGITEAIQGLSVAPNGDGLKNIINGQFWNHAVQGAHNVDDVRHICGTSATELTETQGIREIGFMLCGLPTSIYEQQPDGGMIPSSRYRFKHLSRTAAFQLLEDFATVGSDLARIRLGSSGKQHQPVLQTFQAVSSTKLAETECGLAQLQAECLHSQRGNTASLLCFYEKVKDKTKLIKQLSSIIDQFQQDDKIQASFRILEVLYNSLCINHGIGDTSAFTYVANVFFACLETYLKPLKHFMEYGELSQHDQEIFIQRGRTTASLDSVWADCYQLLLDDAGRLHAPAFLHLAAKKILNAGKSVHFLKLLDYSWLADHAEMHPTVQTSLERMSVDFRANSLHTFSESFDKAVDDWISSSYHSSSALLRHVLDVQLGLHRVLDALEYIYLFRNGAISNSLASTIFARIDRRKADWDDTFVLTDIFRSGFASIACVDTNDLVVRTGTRSASGKLRSIKILNALHLMYMFSWPIANVINKSTLRTYQSIFIFLLQLQRAKQTLERRFPRKMLALLMKDQRGSSAIMLRHRTLWFVNTVFNYLTDVVLSAATADMRRRMAKSGDVDEMIAVHQAYIARLEEQCLLSEDRAPVLQAITSILDLVVLFAEACASYSSHASLMSGNGSKESAPANPDSSHQQSREAEIDLSDSDSDEAELELDSGHVALEGSSITPTFARLENMYDTFMQLQGFVVVGLRGAGNGGEDSGTEMLTDMLAIGYPKGGLRYG
ncbi:MAG: hypothetical protein Q9225_002486 [Loekoesia sp. 1 TL-2023]